MKIGIDAKSPLTCGATGQTLKLSIQSEDEDGNVFFDIPILGSEVPLIELAPEHAGDLGVTFDGQTVGDKNKTTTIGSPGIVTIGVVVKKGGNHALEFHNFRAGTKVGGAKVVVTDSDTKILCSVIVTLTDARQPRIVSFTATPVCAAEGTPLTLSWTTQPETTDPALFTLEPAEERPPVKTEDGWKVETTMAGSTPKVYALSVRDDSTPAHEVVVYPHNTAQFRSYEFHGDILGMFSAGSTLYALAAGSKKDAVLWKTTNGFDPRQWQRVEGATIPVAAARRPGAILGQKLWLVGGDRCDVMKPGSAVGFYDLQQENSWQEDFSNSFPERMGHAVLAVNDALWVIGGLTQGEVYADVWTRTESSPWTALTPPPGFSPRSLFTAAATASTVWVGGGQNTELKLETDLWKYEPGRWSQAIDAVPDFAPNAYRTATMFALDDGPPCLLTTVMAGPSTRRIHLHQITTSGSGFATNQVDLFGGPEIFGPDDDSSLFSCFFNGAAFVWLLNNDSTKKGYSRITYLPVMRAK